jgi:NitT/TauT family transport system substrate-binding protein
VLAATARGAKVKMVGMVFDKTPLNFFSRTENAVRKPKDLEGKTIGAPPETASARRGRPSPGCTASTKARSPGSTSSPPPSPRHSRRSAWMSSPTTPRAALHGKGDGCRAGGDDAVGETGFDMYSMSIMASEKTMKERPKALRAFLEASYLGWRDVMADPKAALAIFKKRVPEIDLSIIEPNMMLGLELMRTQRYATRASAGSTRRRCARRWTYHQSRTWGSRARWTARRSSRHEFLAKVAMPIPAK